MSINKIKIGKKIPEFSLPSTGNKIVKLAELKGKNVIIYFYPKDATPGCTLEGQNFRDNIRKFSSRNTKILGVSRDKITLHEKFKKDQNFPFDLLSDEDEILCKIFDVIKVKNMYGKKVMGIERSTFLIDEKGILRNEWRKVKVKDHAEDVLEELKKIK